MKGTTHLSRLGGRVLRLVGVGLRRMVTVVSSLLLLVVLIAWLRGYYAWHRFTVYRESMGDEGYSLSETRLDIGKGELGFEYRIGRVDRTYAEARGCPPGVRWELFFPIGEPHQVGQRADRSGPSYLFPDKRDWRWDHAGVVLAWREHRETLAGLWGQKLGCERCRFYSMAAPCWMLSLLFVLLPAQRLYAWLRRRQRHRQETRATSSGHE